MAKKITAPHSYDPGKGRPKEYLAYLNEREMAYLRSINGNNMERGPRGLPSFPPNDAIGSSSNAGSKGPGGPSGPNSGPSTGGGGNLGGGGQRGPGGPSGPNSGPSRSGSPSTGGGGKGPGGPSGPNSAPSGTRGVGGPSSPMGGQGPSFSRDTKAQQEAQVRDAIKAVKNSPAFRNDASSGGIRTLSVGPIGTPVNVGPRVSPTQNRASVVGGWGIQGYNSSVPKSPSFASPTTAPEGFRPKNADQIQRSIYGAEKQTYDRVPTGKQFGVLGAGYDERIAPSPSPSTSISSQFPSYKYDSPLTPGMTPDDMARRGALMDQYEREIRDIMRGDPVRTGSPIDAGGIPTGGRDPGKTRSIGDGLSAPTYSGGTFNQENELQQAAVDRAISASIAARELAPEQRPSVTRTGSPIDAGGIATLPSRPASGGFISSADAAMPPRNANPLSGTGYGTFNVPKSAQIDAELGRIERDLNAPPMNEEEKILEVENYPERPTYAAGTYFAPEAPPPTDMYNRSRIGSRIGVGLGGIGARAGRTSYTPGDYDAYRNEGSVPDATNMSTEEMVETLRPSAENRGLTPESWENTPYGEPGDVQRKKDIIDKYGKYVPGTVGVASRIKSKVHDMIWGGMSQEERLDRINKNNRMDQDRIRGLNGNENDRGPYIPPPERMKNVARAEAADGPAKDGSRPEVYYKWDLGIGIPSPSDSDYTLYLKYLQEKAAAQAGFA